ncbi:MAG: HDOD domain-containing protein [Planctomycetaceae bacterium]|nr:HDOD domain-containing protein [Planctomycetaceae bacterium]
MVTAVEEPVQLPSQVVSHIRFRMRDLSMLPAVASQALEISKAPDCEIRDFCAVVERDAKLATDVLCIANSAAFSGGRSVRSLNQAVVRLGFQQCRNLILSSSTSALMKKIHLDEEWIRESLCRHGFLTAFLALKLNRVLNTGFEGDEFTAGLIHDFGRTILAVCFPNEFKTMDPMHFHEDEPDFLNRERAVLGTDHCQVGAWFATNNRLPRELVCCILNHHELNRECPHIRLATLIASADHMANYLQCHGTAQGYEIDRNLALRQLEDYGVPRTLSLLADIAEQLMEATMHEAHEVAGF